MVNDQPFLNSDIIKSFRHDLNLKRNQRKPPTKPLVQDQDGQKYLIETQSDAAIPITYNEKELIDNLITGKIFQTSISPSMIPRMKKIVGQVNKKRKKNGLPEFDVSIDHKQDVPSNGKVLAIIAEPVIYKNVLKWAYLLTCISAPLFIKCELANEMRLAILSEDDRALNFFLKRKNPVMENHITNQLSANLEMDFQGYQILLLDYLPYGSLALIQLFKFTFIIPLGRSLFPKYLLWSNPCHGNAFKLYQQGNISTSNVTLTNPDKLGYHESLKLCNGKGGEIDYAKLTIHSKDHRLNGLFKSENHMTYSKPYDVFLKEEPSGRLHPVESFTVWSKGSEVKYNAWTGEVE